MTGFVPIMWLVWGVLVILLFGLKIYTDRLSRDEDDQIVLDDAFDHLKVQQAAIVAKVNKVQPLRRLVLWLVGAMTLVVVAYYAMDVFNQFK